MNDLLSSVRRMHLQFGVYNLLDQVKEDYTRDQFKEHRVLAMVEEVGEFQDAKNSEDELDALVDLVVFALGTADLLGYDQVFDLAYQRVMIANCQKIVGPVPERGNFPLDLKKPVGWTPATFKDIMWMVSDNKRIDK